MKKPIKPQKPTYASVKKELSINLASLYVEEIETICISEIIKNNLTDNIGLEVNPYYDEVTINVVKLPAENEISECLKLRLSEFEEKEIEYTKALKCYEKYCKDTEIKDSMNKIHSLKSRIKNFEDEIYKEKLNLENNNVDVSKLS